MSKVSDLTQGHREAHKHDIRSSDTMMPFRDEADQLPFIITAKQTQKQVSSQAQLTLVDVELCTKKVADSD